MLVILDMFRDPLSGGAMPAGGVDADMGSA